MTRTSVSTPRMAAQSIDPGSCALVTKTNPAVQILETQAALARAQAEEEAAARAAASNPAEARRWNGLRTIVEARSMLKVLFRVATAHKAQVYEVGNELVEVREEVELLRLQLELAQQEEAAAKRALAASQAALAAALAAPEEPAAPESAHENVDEEAESLMEELEGIESLAADIGSPLLESLNKEARLGSRARADLLGRYDDAIAESLESGSSNGMIEDESADDEVSGESDDDEWDPSLATPAAVGRRRTRSGSRRLSRPSAVSALTRGRLGSGLGSGGQTPSTQERCATAVRESLEEPVLLAINAERRRDGAEPISKLTVPALKAHLRGKWVGGQEWRPGNKKRSELIDDYRQFMGLHVDRTGPSRSLRKLSESPAEDLIAAGNDAEAALQPQHALGPVPFAVSANSRPAPIAPQQRFMQSPVAKQYREQCSAALRRVHSLQQKIDDLQAFPASGSSSPAKLDSRLPSSDSAMPSAEPAGRSNFTIPALPPRGVPSHEDFSSKALAADALGHAFRRLSTADGGGVSAENAAATNLAVDGHRSNPSSRQHSMADEDPAPSARYRDAGMSAGASPSRHPVSYPIASLPVSPAPPLPEPARPTGDSAPAGAVLESQPPNQAETQQPLPLKPKRILLSSQQTGLKAGAVKASPRILPAWV
ncbi:hypothetical protein COCOBI_03-8100 [Coccomyxa sp. Obi]|nr:hypothetical protein COCOBI_03-8100 [Coccomyxa sp. Obi]